MPINSISSSEIAQFDQNVGEKVGYLSKTPEEIRASISFTAAETIRKKDKKR